MPTAAAPVIDPYDLMEAVNVLGQLPKDFYEKIVRNNNIIIIIIIMFTCV